MSLFEDPTTVITEPSLPQVLAFINTATGNFFGVMILFMTWIILFIGLKNYDNITATTVASFITMIVAIMLRALAIITDGALIIAITINFLAIIMLYLFKE